MAHDLVLHESASFDYAGFARSRHNHLARGGNIASGRNGGIATKYAASPYAGGVELERVVRAQSNQECTRTSWHVLHFDGVRIIVRVAHHPAVGGPIFHSGEQAFVGDLVVDGDDVHAAQLDGNASLDGLGTSQTNVRC